MKCADMCITYKYICSTMIPHKISETRIRRNVNIYQKLQKALNFPMLSQVGIG